VDEEEAVLPVGKKIRARDKGTEEKGKRDFPRTYE
jgi:hypothetical protein